MNKQCSDHDKGGCSHYCQNITDHRYICACYPGYIISKFNNKHCEDINECAEGTHHCTQLCMNLNGTHACSCRPGFRIADNLSGVCRAEEDNALVIYATGSEIRAFDVHKRVEMPVIANEKRVQALDFDPRMEYVYWIDSHDNRIKRSFMINAKNGDAKIGFAQDLNIHTTFRSSSYYKPTSLAVDWVTQNIYWTEKYVSSGYFRIGRVVVAKSDGRYKRTIALVLDPVAIAVDPELGIMVWADGGSDPKIETAWMDGSKSRVLVNDKIGKPSALTIDYAMDHTLYWADSKLNVIESIRLDGANRKVVLRSDLKDSLKHPVSLDVFENVLYWTTKETGELIRQDKFGRGVPQIVKSNLETSGAVKIYHPLRYNTSLVDPCHSSGCSHLCVAIHGGHRCLCPENPRLLLPHPSETRCDATEERPKPAPRICQCQNGGFCLESDNNELICQCQNEYQGQYCEVYPAATRSGSSTAAIVIPIVVSILVLLGAAAVILVLKKRPL